MKCNKVILGILTSAVLVSPISSVYASNDNPLSDSQGETEEKLKQKAKEIDNSGKAEENQPFHIKEEAYGVFSESKKSFMSLQNQYGSLDKEANAGQGFKSYLKNIQEDKENQQFQAMINQMAQGNYSVKIDNDSLTSLKDAMNSTEKSKKEDMDKQDEKAKENENNEISFDNYDSDVAFGEGFGNDTSALKDKYDNSKLENAQKQEDEKTNSVKEFGETKESNKKNDEKNKNSNDEIFNNEKKQSEKQVGKNQDILSKQNQSNQQKTDSINNSLKANYSNQTSENEKQFKDKQESAKDFASNAAGQNKTTQKNYNVLRNQIINVQKSLNSASQSASTSKSYVNKVKSIIQKVTK